MQKIWNWLNGNKIEFGLVLAWLASKIPPSLPLFGLEWLSWKEVLEALAGVLTGVGVIHRIAKSNTDPGVNK